MQQVRNHFLFLRITHEIQVTSFGHIFEFFNQFGQFFAAAGAADSPRRRRTSDRSRMLSKVLQLLNCGLNTSLFKFLYSIGSKRRNDAGNILLFEAGHLSLWIRRSESTRTTRNLSNLCGL